MSFNFWPLTFSVTGTAPGPMTFSALAFSSSAATYLTCAVAAVAATVPRLFKNVRRECAPKFSGSGFFMQLEGGSCFYVIFRRIQVKRQTGIIYDMSDAAATRKFQKIFQRARAGAFQGFKRGTRQNNRMRGVSAKHWLANGIQILPPTIQQHAQCFSPQMRLVAKCNCPACDVRLPAAPSRCAHNGTEHAALRARVFDSVRFWKIQTVQFRRERRIIGPQHDGDLRRTQFMPLRNQMANDRHVTPRQQQFRPAHPRRQARAENDNSEPFHG